MNHDLFGFMSKLWSKLGQHFALSGPKPNISGYGSWQLGQKLLHQEEAAMYGFFCFYVYTRIFKNMYIYIYTYMYK